MEAIENVIDSWMIANVISEIGAGSSYTSLKVKQVESAILRTPRDWEDWKMPAVGVAARIEQWESDEHFGGNIVLGNQIPYILTIVVNDTESAAIANARTILSRLKTAVKTFHADVGSLVTDTGEQVERVYFYKSGQALDAGRIRLRKYDDPKNANMKYVAIDLSMVITTIGG